MKTIKCAWCDKIFEKSTKKFNQTEKLGQRHACSRTCASKLTNEERRCIPSTKNAEKTRRDKEKFPEKDKARSIVRKAIKNGTLIPLTECEICGDFEDIEAHHPDHNRPLLLLYVCKKCHTYADSQPDKLENLSIDYS